MSKREAEDWALIAALWAGVIALAGVAFMTVSWGVTAWK